MPEDNAAADNEATVLQPHGREQQVKMEILDMIHGGKDPFAIIYHVAKWLEKVSDEPGYAQYVEDQLKAVYGLALQHVRPMQEELAEVEARLERIKKAYASDDFTEEEHLRIGFAIEHHKKDIERLKERIQIATANHESLMMEKD